MNHHTSVPLVRIDDDLIAAILAAIHLYLAAEEVETTDTTLPRSSWQSAALIAVQGGLPAPGKVAATWSTVDRVSRAARWSAGMLGIFD